MTSSTDMASEPRLAAAAELCEHALTPEIRFQISLMTIFFPATLTSVATLLILLVTWQFSFALLGTI